MSHSCGGTAEPVLKNLLDWCGHWEKNTTDGVSYALAAKVYKLRKPALLDDMRRLLSCRLSGKSQHSITHNYTRYRWTPTISAFSADSMSAALIWSKCLSLLNSGAQCTNYSKAALKYSPPKEGGEVWISLSVSPLSVNNVDKYFKLSPEWS